MTVTVREARAEEAAALTELAIRAKGSWGYADPNAEAIYARLGFETFGRSPSGSIPGRFLPRMRMGL